MPETPPQPDTAPSYTPVGEGDICIDCDGRGIYPSKALCVSCGGTGAVCAGDGISRDTAPSPLSTGEVISRRDIHTAMLDAWNTICEDTGCHPLDIERRGKELFFKPGHWADLVALFLDADDTSMPEGCDWPDGIFTFADEPGEHDPCYVVMPDGAMIALNHHAREGVDIARAKFIVAACNAALSQPPATEQCERCQGNGEIVKNWDDYLHSADRATEEASVTECPDCDGTGHIDASPPATEQER